MFYMTVCVNEWLNFVNFTFLYIDKPRNSTVFTTTRQKEISVYLDSMLVCTCVDYVHQTDTAGNKRCP